MTPVAPGQIEVHAAFRISLGPRFEAAGLRVQFHYNQAPGVHFKADPPEEYRAAIIQGIEMGMALRFPDFPSTGSVWITEVTADEVYSSVRAFYRAGRLVIDQAYSLSEITKA
jgi:hypothetical protein